MAKSERMTDRRALLRKALETFYTHEDGSLRAAAKKFGVSYSTARRWAKAGAWNEKRATFTKKVEKKAEEGAVERKAATLSLQENLVYHTAGALGEVLSAQLKELRENPRSKPALSKLRDAIDVQQRFDDLVLLVLGNLEKARGPVRSDYRVHMGDDGGGAAQTRIEERHFDAEGREVDSEGNVLR